MLKVLTGEASKGYNIKNETEQSRIMDKYSSLKRFHHERRPQLYMYVFMYVYPQTIPAEDQFFAIKNFVVNHKKISTPGTVPKHLLLFCYISSEDYELDKNFDDIEMKKSIRPHI